MAMRYGEHKLLEAEANRMLRESLHGVTSFAAKKDILTPWKEAEIKRRSVQSASGIADPAVRQGIYRRSANPARPDLNSRDGVMRPRARGMTSTLGSFVDEHRLD